MTLSNLDVHYLIQEAKSLEGEFLQKAFGQEGIFRFKFRHTDFVAHLPEAAFLTQMPPQFTAHPSSYVMLLRKRLTGRLEKISQVGFDRIIQLHFADVSVVMELFGDGNLLLLDGVDFILKPWRAEEFASRKLYAGQKYVAPPQDKAHPDAFKPGLLHDLTGQLISALTKTVNLSPFYLEEACARAGLDKIMPVRSLNAAQKDALQVALASLLKEPLAPQVYLEDGKVTHAAPFALQSLKHLESKSTATFSEALEMEFQTSHAQQIQQAEKVVEDEPDERKAAVMEKQRFLLETFQSRAQIAQSKAEWIYLHFSMIEALRDHSDSEEETIRNLKLVPEGIQYRKKRHRIEVELPDPENGKNDEMKERSEASGKKKNVTSTFSK
ncbi:NFACT family protein [Candidatus Micrarchaeota archaeon]|nr:NFACT family protein [Candidatus Micrarchaeota archaeon]